GADVIYATSRKWLTGPRGVGMLGVAEPWWGSLKVRIPAMLGDAPPVRALESDEANEAGRVGLAEAVALAMAARAEGGGGRAGGGADAAGRGGPEDAGGAGRPARLGGRGRREGALLDHRAAAAGRPGPGHGPAAADRRAPDRDVGVGGGPRAARDDRADA